MSHSADITWKRLHLSRYHWFITTRRLAFTTLEINHSSTSTWKISELFQLFFNCPRTMGKSHAFRRFHWYIGRMNKNDWFFFRSECMKGKEVPSPMNFVLCWPEQLGRASLSGAETESTSRVTTGLAVGGLFTHSNHLNAWLALQLPVPAQYRISDSKSKHIFIVVRRNSWLILLLYKNKINFIVIFYVSFWIREMSLLMYLQGYVNAIRV